MQILLNTNNNQQKPTFQGLNRYLSKHFPQEEIGVISKQAVSSSEFVMEAINKYPKSRRFVGNLPPDWIERLPKENRKDYVQKIQDLFSNLAEILSSKETEYNLVVAKNQRHLTNFKLQFKNLLGADVGLYTLSPEGNGSFAKAYVLKIDEKKYLFKVFHSDQTKQKRINSSWKLVEPARAPFVMRTSKKGFAKFYFGRMAGLNDKDGFMLTEFLQEKLMTEKQQCRNLLRLLTSHVLSLDILYYGQLKNVINLKIFDYGELTLQPPEFLKKIKPKNNKLNVQEVKNIIYNTPPKIKTDSKIKGNVDYRRIISTLLLKFKIMNENLHD